MEAVVWQSVTQQTLLSIYLYLKVFTVESLVWFEASGFCYTVDAGPSLELLLVILLLP